MAKMSTVMRSLTNRVDRALAWEDLMLLDNRSIFALRMTNAKEPNHDRHGKPRIEQDHDPEMVSIGVTVMTA